MALKTRGFVNQIQLNRHFVEHGADFGASNAQEYEEAADAFLAGTMHVTTRECTRTKGDIIRYDQQTQAYGILDSRGIIRTYFKPVPCSTISASARHAIRLSGRCHQYRDNFLYFQSECGR
jgi:pyocin large subunit-like protein